MKTISIFAIALCLAASQLAAQSIQPQDGTWKIQPSPIANDGCPEFLLELISFGAVAPLRFDVPYEPNLGQSTVRVSENHWRAQEVFEDEDENGLYRWIVTNDLRVLATTELRQDRIFVVETSGTRHQEIGMTGASCRASVSFAVTRTGR